ncbi:MAG: hypothetical protein ACTSX7_03715 [Alphaproteobacteria bacterium]
MFEALTSNPAFDATVLPLGVALAATLLIWLIAGPYRAPQIIFAAAMAGILAAYWSIENLPPVLPVTGKQKLFYFIILLLVAGWAIDGPERRQRRLSGAARLSLFGLPALALIWLAWRPLLDGPDVQLLSEMAVLWLVAVLVHWRLQGQERAGALVGGVQVLVAAAGLAVVAVIGASASLAALAGAVAAAMGGVLLWLFVKTLAYDERFGFGALGWLASAGVLLFIGDVLVLFAPDVNRWSLALLLLVFLADKVPAGRRSRGALGRAMNPVVLTMIAAVPVVAAVGLAMLSGGGDSPY